MPRKGREVSSTGIYHVMLRGFNRQDIFDDADDYREFIKILSAVQEHVDDGQDSRITTCHIYAYCLMPNHVHLLVCEKHWRLGDIMKSIASSYVFYYNKKYGRIGHLFQDRFKSEPCNTPEYFITLYRYIHQNPVKAGLVQSAQDYEYSSWPNDYLLLGSQHVCYTQAALRRYGLKELAAWVDMPLPEETGCMDLNERKIVSDETVRSYLLAISGTKNVTEFQLLDKQRKKDIVSEVMSELNVGPRQASRVSGLTYNVVQYLAKR